MKLIITTIMLALSFSGALAQTETPVSKRDQKFVLEAGQAGLMEVKLSELAQTNASSAEVRALAQNMVTDHNLSNEELKAFADKKNIYFPAELNSKQQKAYNQMAEFQSSSFDKKYTQWLKKSHKKVICLYKKAAKKATDPELKSWAAQKISQLEHHQEMIETTCKSLK